MTSVIGTVDRASPCSVCIPPLYLSLELSYVGGRRRRFHASIPTVTLQPKQVQQHSNSRV